MLKKSGRRRTPHRFDYDPYAEIWNGEAERPRSHPDSDNFHERRRRYGTRAGPWGGYWMDREAEAAGVPTEIYRSTASPARRGTGSGNRPGKGADDLRPIPVKPPQQRGAYKPHLETFLGRYSVEKLKQRKAAQLWAAFEEHAREHLKGVRLPKDRRVALRTTEGIRSAITASQAPG